MAVMTALCPSRMRRSCMMLSALPTRRSKYSPPRKAAPNMLMSTTDRSVSILPPIGSKTIYDRESLPLDAGVVDDCCPAFEVGLDQATKIPWPIGDRCHALLVEQAGDLRIGHCLANLVAQPFGDGKRHVGRCD